MFAEIIDGLCIEAKAPFALQALEVLTKENQDLVKWLASTHNKLLINIISLAESPDEQVASSAIHVKMSIEKILSGITGEELGDSLTSLVHEGLSGTGTNSVTYVALFL